MLSEVLKKDAITIEECVNIAANKTKTEKALVLKKDAITIEECVNIAANKTKTEKALVLKIIENYYLNMPKKEIENSLKKIKATFGLSAIDFDILRSYVEHIHKNSKRVFLENLQSRDSSYIKKFLSVEFEKFGENIFEHGSGEEGSGEEGSDEEGSTLAKPFRPKHKDLYKMRKENDPKIYFGIPSTFVKVETT